MAKLNKTKQNCCSPHCRCHHLGYSMPPAHHCTTIWCRSTFGPRGPGLSNPTSFLRPALPMAPTTDNNARDERSVLRPNPATFLRDFTVYMTTNYAIIRKMYLNYNPFSCFPKYTRHHTHAVIWSKYEKKLDAKGVNSTTLLLTRLLCSVYKR